MGELIHGMILQDCIHMEWILIKVFMIMLGLIMKITGL